LDDAKKAILSNPRTYRIRYQKKVRSFVLDRFPYLILYIVEGKNINVISVFNTHRHPRNGKKASQKIEPKSELSDDLFVDLATAA